MLHVYFFLKKKQLYADFCFQPISYKNIQIKTNDGKISIKTSAIAGLNLSA